MLVMFSLIPLTNAGMEISKTITPFGWINGILKYGMQRYAHSPCTFDHEG